MRGRNEETAQATFSRVSAVLGGEKGGMKEECKRVALYDLTRVVREYFDLKTPVEMEISQDKGVYSVQITFTADRVKEFMKLP